MRMNGGEPTLMCTSDAPRSTAYAQQLVEIQHGATPSLRLGRHPAVGSAATGAASSRRSRNRPNRAQSGERRRRRGGPGRRRTTAAPGPARGRRLRPRAGAPTRADTVAADRVAQRVEVVAALEERDEPPGRGASAATRAVRSA